MPEISKRKILPFWAIFTVIGDDKFSEHVILLLEGVQSKSYRLRGGGRGIGEIFVISQRI
jgi:hypothetical protein